MIKIDRKLIRIGLTLIGIVGVPLTSLLSVKCSKNADQTENKKEKVKCYIPAIISGIVTCGCIGGSHHIGSKEIAAITATATYAITNRNILDKKLRPLITEEEIKEVKNEVVKAIPEESKDEYTGHGTLKFVEDCTGRKFYSSLDKVIEAENRINKDLREGYAVCLNDFYKYLGLSSSYAGERFGWVPLDIPDKSELWGCIDSVTFHHQMVEGSDGKPMCIIEMLDYPQEGWAEVIC